MSDKIKIEWRVEDGYVNNGPHTLTFFREEWESWDEDTRHEAVTEAAMQRISIAWKERK